MGREVRAASSTDPEGAPHECIAPQAEKEAKHHGVLPEGLAKGTLHVVPVVRKKGSVRRVYDFRKVAEVYW